MKVPNYSSRYMSIHAAADLSKSLQTPSPESTFQVGSSQLKSVRELSDIFDAENKIPNRDTLPTPPAPITKKRSKLPKVEDHTSPPPRVDPDDKSKDIYQKLPIPIQATPTSASTREKYTKKSKEPVKQRCRGHYTGNKYDLLRVTHRQNTSAQVTRVEPKAQHISVLATNLQGRHQANVFSDPKTGASLEYRHLIKGPTKDIWGELICKLNQQTSASSRNNDAISNKNHILHPQGKFSGM